MTGQRQQNLKRLLRPRHIAVLGGRDAEVVAGECRRIGYEGPFWPVNPNRETIGGFPCFSRIEDLPEAPDAVFIAVPREQAIESLAKLGRMGAGGAVCYTAGFGEIGDEGAALEAELIRAAGDMALVGPNCYGLINYGGKVALWPFAHGGRFTGRGAAIITQSGMLSSDLTMSQRSLPMSYMVSLGNQAVLKIDDFIDCFAEMPEVSAIGLHVEGIRDSRLFEAAALKALHHNIPIVVLKTGTSRIGSELTVSHTGSLSGAEEAYDAFFDRLGIIRVDEPSLLLEVLKFITVAGIPVGPRLAGLACSGGGATMLADNAERLGLDLPRPGPEANEKLRAMLPLTATVSNPLDYTTPIWGMPEKTEPVFSAMFEDGYDAAVIIQDYPAAGLDESKPYYRNDSISFIKATKAHGLPGAVCCTIAENLDEETRDFLIEHGTAPMQGIGDCLRAIAAAAEYGRKRQQILASPPPPLHLAGPKGEGMAETLDEAAAKEMLSAAGIAVPEGLVIAGDLPTQLPGNLAYPLALKMVSPDLPHKSEMGAVALSITDREMLEKSMTRMREEVSRHAPAARQNGFLIETMVSGVVAELMVSLRRDPVFGILLTIASGGVLVELLGDASTLIVPARPEMINAGISRLAAGRIIDGYRGGKPGDREAVISTILALTDMMMEDERIDLIEVNPLFVLADGAVVVDALITLSR
ncbi:acetate--CoA ligase family protein [Alphaproteobacteria bacterium LSUCC0684]